MKRKILAAFCLISVIMGVLFFRLYSLSSSEALASAANRQGTKTLTVYQSRGQIYDCNYQKMVNTAKGYIASVLPSPSSASLLLDYVPVLKRSSVLDQLQKGTLFATVLERPLPNDTIDLHSFPYYKRYEDKQSAVHIIGHLTNGNLDGGYGIEKAYDSFLKENTTKTTITYFLDALGRSIQGKQPQLNLENASSAGVVLTIDSRIQTICEEVGEKMLAKGAIVVMTPNGNIKACASFPTFSPNNLTESLHDQENKPMFNRAFGSYNVGSTFKVSTAAAALESGISPNYTYRCTGEINVNGQIFKCHKHEGHGVLNMKQAMAESCNPYFISLGLKLNKEKMYQMAKDLSFSKTMELAPGFSPQSGYLPTIKELFNPADVANFSFGQGLLMATPIQLTQMMCSIVNGGKPPSPKLVEGLSQDGKTLFNSSQSSAAIDAMKPETAAQIKSFLVYSVMNKANQYAKPAKTTAGGKTATAQTGNYIGEEEINQGWFCGFFPAENPKYVVTVLCENAESGNISASPVFRESADRVTAECPS